jgi:hypothetical protein
MKASSAAAFKAQRVNVSSAGFGVRQPSLLFTRILHGFGVDDQAAVPVLSPQQPTPTACGRARLTSQIQFLAPRLKAQVIYDLESRPFR